MRMERDRLIPLLFLFFFPSGLTSLIYEVLWLRMITRGIGGAPFAVSTVLAIAYLGRLYLLEGKARQAIEHYSRSLELNPGDASLHNELGWLLHRRGKTEKAIGHYQKAIQSKPYFYPEAMANLARARQSQGDWEAALSLYEKILQWDEETAKAWAFSARIHTRRQDYTRAIKNMEKALQLRPKWIRAYNSMAWIVLRAAQDGQANATRAVGHAQKACQLSKEDKASLPYTLSVAHAAASDWEKFRKIAGSALSPARKKGDRKLAGVIEKHLRKIRFKRSN